MLVAYIPILLFILVAIGFAIFTLLLSGLLHPEKYNKVKLEPYECGIEPVGRYWSQMHFRYYVFGILFLIFDVEAVFLFPWAVIFLDQKVTQANPVPFYAMIMFLAVLAFAIVYAWRKGALDWKR